MIPELAAVLDTAFNILTVVLGLGLVIFFHELGHFAVAKWCNVNVERFSIGFGPVIWSFKKGETEYALSLVPFGGYVKMLGQDDMDPSQLTSDEIARDPRSYSSKSVWQRMAIISAGVIMNVITGLLFFALAFRMGIETPSPVVGYVVVGLPAWEAGLESGDRITEINNNGERVDSFTDILRGVALTTGEVRLEGTRIDGSEFDVVMKPDNKGTRRMIGVAPSYGLQVVTSEVTTLEPVMEGSPAASTKEPGFERGDIIRKVDDTEIESHAQLMQVLGKKRGEKVVISVQRSGASAEELTEITVEPNPFRTLGFHTDIGQIVAIQKGSPADKAGFKVGDKIATITEEDGTKHDVGGELNPLRLPDFFQEHAGDKLIVTVRRLEPGTEEQLVPLEVVPLDKPGWLDAFETENMPLAVPALGLAYHLSATVIGVDQSADSPAKGKIEKLDQLKKIELILPDGVTDEASEKKVVSIKLSNEGSQTGEKVNNLAYAFWALQRAPKRTVKITLVRGGEEKVVELTPVRAKDWYLPERGLRTMPLSTDLKADSLGESFQMGLTHTRNTIIQIYLTIRNLGSGDLSYKELHGPIGIAKVAYAVASQGLADLLIFLGFLSINLAVLNFLPIPVLDGGHMVFLIWEAVTRKRPSEKVMIIATYCGLAFVLLLMLLVIYLDLFVHKM